MTLVPRKDAHPQPSPRARARMHERRVEQRKQTVRRSLAAHNRHVHTRRVSGSVRAAIVRAAHLGGLSILWVCLDSWGAKRLCLL